MLYCFAKIILGNVIKRKVLNINDGYVALNDDGSVINTQFDVTDNKLIEVVAKIWTLTLFVIPLNLILGGVVIYRWYKFDTASEWLLYANWCLDVITGNIAVLCIALQFNVNRKWYHRLCKCCNKCWTKYLENRINSQVKNSLLETTDNDKV